MKSCGVTIQMKATEQYFAVVLFIMLYKMVLTFESMNNMLFCGVTIWMNASCQYVHRVPYIMLYKVDLS